MDSVKLFNLKSLENAQPVDIQSFKFNTKRKLSHTENIPDSTTSRNEFCFGKKHKMDVTDNVQKSIKWRSPLIYSPPTKFSPKLDFQASVSIPSYQNTSRQWEYFDASNSILPNPKYKPSEVGLLSSKPNTNQSFIRLRPSQTATKFPLCDDECRSGTSTNESLDKLSATNSLLEQQFSKHISSGCDYYLQVQSESSQAMQKEDDNIRSCSSQVEGAQSNPSSPYGDAPNKSVEDELNRTGHGVLTPPTSPERNVVPAGAGCHTTVQTRPVLTSNPFVQYTMRPSYSPLMTPVTNPPIFHRAYPFYTNPFYAAPTLQTPAIPFYPPGSQASILSRFNQPYLDHTNPTLPFYTTSSFQGPLLPRNVTQGHYVEHNQFPFYVTSVPQVPISSQFTFRPNDVIFGTYRNNQPIERLRALVEDAEIEETRPNRDPNPDDKQFILEKYMNSLPKDRNYD